jgi:uncharacterized protein YndB with AHSA1/START domain
VPTTRRARTLAASPEALWETVGDPHHLPRWWPRVARVEAVEAGRFTAALATDRGRTVRADFVVVASEPPVVRAWEQELAGTPFERVLAAARTEVRLGVDAAGTRVTLELRQRLRGMSQLGGFMLRRANRRLLDEALDALEGLHGA